MIAVDTSALMAIALDEARASDCLLALQTGGQLLISAVTLAETQIVAHGRNLATRMERSIELLDFQVIAADGATARRVGRIYARWGKGMNIAKLNICDCFAYDVAVQHAIPLLYVGDDFTRTDVRSVL